MQAVIACPAMYLELDLNYLRVNKILMFHVDLLNDVMVILLNLSFLNLSSVFFQIELSTCCADVRNSGRLSIASN